MSDSTNNNELDGVFDDEVANGSLTPGDKIIGSDAQNDNAQEGHALSDDNSEGFGLIDQDDVFASSEYLGENDVNQEDHSDSSDIDDDFSDIDEFDSTPSDVSVLSEEDHTSGKNEAWEDSDEFEDPTQDDNVAIAGDTRVFDDEEVAYYNENYNDANLGVDDLDEEMQGETGLPWWVWLIVAGVIIGLLGGGAYAYAKMGDGKDGGLFSGGKNSGNTTGVSAPVAVDGENEGSNVSNSELNAIRKRLTEAESELDKANQENEGLKGDLEKARNEAVTVTEKGNGEKAVTSTKRAPAQTITDTVTVTSQAPAPAPRTITSTVNGDTKTVTRTSVRDAEPQTVTHTQRETVTSTKTNLRTTTVTYERYIQQRYS